MLFGQNKLLEDQNKNWYLSMALCSEVNKKTGPERINVKYFIPGQTYMSADSFHHIVEKRLRDVKNV